MKPTRLPVLLSLLCMAASQPVQARINNIILVHGAFTDGSAWQEVIDRLQTRGYHVTAVQNPLTSLKDDVAATERVIDRQQGEVVLVGHSWAGAVIAQAGNNPKVKKLVFLSALAPDSGESVTSLLTRLNAPMADMRPDKNGLIWLDDPDAYQRTMANDLPLKRVKLLTATQQPIAVNAFSEKIEHAAWREKPSWYLITEDDRALSPSVQQQLVGAMNATVLRIKSNHMSMISHPDAVSQFIEQATQTDAKETKK